ncbi:MAG TPA: hypothetical protein GX734_04925 [Clostridiaceae bacterium]|nr:hypothetical protein [Clostridiaceae bacterium]
MGTKRDKIAAFDLFPGFKAVEERRIQSFHYTTGLKAWLWISIISYTLDLIRSLVRSANPLVSNEEVYLLHAIFVVFNMIALGQIWSSRKAGIWLHFYVFVAGNTFLMIAYHNDPTVLWPVTSMDRSILILAMIAHILFMSYLLFVKRPYFPYHGSSVYAKFREPKRPAFLSPLLHLSLLTFFGALFPVADYFVTAYTKQTSYYYWLRNRPHDVLTEVLLVIFVLVNVIAFILYFRRQVLSLILFTASLILQRKIAGYSTISYMLGSKGILVLFALYYYAILLLAVTSAITYIVLLIRENIRLQNAFASSLTVVDSTNGSSPLPTTEERDSDIGDDALSEHDSRTPTSTNESEAAPQLENVLEAEAEQKADVAPELASGPKAKVVPELKQAPEPALAPEPRADVAPESEPVPEPEFAPEPVPALARKHASAPNRATQPETKICPVCGRIMRASALFCNRCGNSFAEYDAGTPTSTSRPETKLEQAMGQEPTIELNITLASDPLSEPTLEEVQAPVQEEQSETMAYPENGNMMGARAFFYLKRDNPITKNDTGKQTVPPEPAMKRTLEMVPESVLGPVQASEQEAQPENRNMMGARAFSILKSHPIKESDAGTPSPATDPELKLGLPTTKEQVLNVDTTPEPQVAIAPEHSLSWEPVFVPEPAPPLPDREAQPERKICPRCGNAIRVRASFCNRCGHSFAENDAGKLVSVPEPEMKLGQQTIQILTLEPEMTPEFVPLPEPVLKVEIEPSPSSGSAFVSEPPPRQKLDVEMAPDSGIASKQGVQPDAKACPRCGKTMKARASFCNRCGLRL